MKIIFRKNDESEISVFQKIDGEEKEFSYIDMIKQLINTKELEEAEIDGEFTEAEIKSINSMVSFINKEVAQA